MRVISEVEITEGLLWFLLTWVGVQTDCQNIAAQSQGYEKSDCILKKEIPVPPQKWYFSETKSNVSSDKS